MDRRSNPRTIGSLRLRLLLGTLAWIAVSILVAGFGLSSLFRQHVGAQFQAALGTHLDQLAAHLAIDPAGQISLTAAQSDPRFAKPYSGIYWQIDRIAGFERSEPGVLRSRSLWDTVLQAPLDRSPDGDIHWHRIPGPNNTTLGMLERIVMLEDSPNASAPSFRLIVAADERQMAEPVERFNGMLWLALGLLGAGLALAAVIEVVIALAPLRRLHGALASVRSGRTLTLEGRFPSEVQPLVEEFNSVLAQNAEVVKRARSQAGNLAHALKTPLSVIANSADEKSDEASRRISAQVELAKQQIDYHLRHSRIAASVHLPGIRTPVLPVLDGLIRAMRRIHAERDLELVVHPVSRPVHFRGEEQDLQELLGNLLDNACKWARQRIEITLEFAGHEIFITLDDDGCGIAESERERVLSRGERLDEQVPGSGLGLAIVDDLVSVYGGHIELGESPLGGLRVVVGLPTAE